MTCIGFNLKCDNTSVCQTVFPTFRNTCCCNTGVKCEWQPLPAA